MSSSTAFSLPTVSYVVIAYNESAGIVDCLSSIAAQDDGSIYEILVVDDHSTDETAKLVLEFATDRPEIELLRHGTNLGRGAARSTGVAAAKADLIAMVDADIILPKDWLRRCRSALFDNAVHAVGGVAVPDGDVAYVHRKFSLTPKITSMTTQVPGSNGLFRREVFDLVNIDPSLVEGEDVALNFAMRRAGLRCISIGDLLVEHRENKDFLPSLRWLYQSGKGASRQLIRYRKLRTPDVALGGLIALVALSLVARRRGTDGRLLLGALSIYLLGVSGAQMIKKFRFQGSEMKWALATMVNTALIGSYFAGRIVGLPEALRNRTAVQ
jgi:glycosyltransferase involved in cell wall biosynthesis